MITLEQPGFKKFIIYVCGFIFFTLFIYLGLPFFFDYESRESLLEKKIYNKFGIYLDLNKKVKYNIFPSPRINIKNIKILNFSDGSKEIGNAEKIFLKIPFKNLASLQKIDFNFVQITNANINIQITETSNFKKYLNTLKKEKKIKFKKSKINLLNEKDLLFSIDVKEINASKSNLSNKFNLVGKAFNTKLKFNYLIKNFDNDPKTNFALGFPDIGLNIKLNTNVDKKTKNEYYGKASIFFPNNQFYLDYIFNKNVINISSSKLINSYFKGILFGKLALFPYLIFDLELDISSLKFKNILNSGLIKNNILGKLFPLNKKINGTTSIKINEIASSSNIINSGVVNLEFKNGVLIIEKMLLKMNNIGNVKINGKILQKEKKKIFKYNAKINIDNSKNFYSRFLISKKNRINLKPMNLEGSIDLMTSEIKLNKVYFESSPYKNELNENQILSLTQKINDIFLQNSINNILKYSNLRKIIQSFFLLD